MIPTPPGISLSPSTGSPASSASTTDHRSPAALPPIGTPPSHLPLGEVLATCPSGLAPASLTPSLTPSRQLAPAFLTPPLPPPGVDLEGPSSPVTSPPSRGSPTSTAVWRLVWVHERCHKQEALATRAELGKAAPHALTCLKKAEKFAVWLTHAWPEPYVLLTDWREVKPCLQALSDQPCACRPVMTVVLAEEAKQFERASTWARSNPQGAGFVYVFKEALEVKEFLEEYMASATRYAPIMYRQEAYGDEPYPGPL